MKLRFTPRATQDLGKIADYIHSHSPHAAQRVRDAILHSIQNLMICPELGRRQKVEGVRKWVTGKYRYLVNYTVSMLRRKSLSSALCIQLARGSMRMREQR